MADVSDLSAEVISRALTALAQQVPPEVYKALRSLAAEGRLLESGVLSATITKAASQLAQNAD